MATKRAYRPGSFYRIDARTGFAERAERTRKEWTGQLVRVESWEPRQPQDFVRGSVDDQTVPEPRPRLPETFVASGITNLANDAGVFDGIGDFEIGISEIGDAYHILVDSTAGWLSGDVLWIMQDTGDYWRCEIMTTAFGDGIGTLAVGQSFIGTQQEAVPIVGNQVAISPPLVRSASAGNLVMNVSAQGRIAGAAYEGEIGAFGIGSDEIGVTVLDEFGQAPEGFLNDGTIAYGIR